MYSFEKLNNSNMLYFKKLNMLKKKFNNLNEDFFEKYDHTHFINKLILKKRVSLVKSGNDFTGFVWITPKNSLHFVINSMNFIECEDTLKSCSFLLSKLKNDSTFTYICEKNYFNFDLLKSAGFKPLESTLHLSLSLYSISKFVIDHDVEFEMLKKGKHEEKRCEIQNQVFQNINRLPLSLEDIYEDEIQNYYFDRGAIFIKKDNIYLGYGQIIVENDCPTIVNLGILERYRSNDYGKNLLKHLINIVIEEGYNKVNIKVASDNSIALNLYTGLGFVIENESCKWEFKIDK